MKTPLEQELLDALAQLENAIKAMPAIEAKPNLLLLFARIDELANQLPQTADPELRHFLQRKSYEKARLLLRRRNEEIMPDRCR
jgi:NAD-specific glutamate dehydrogenase